MANHLPEGYSLNQDQNTNKKLLTLLKQRLGVIVRLLENPKTDPEQGRSLAERRSELESNIKRLEDITTDIASILAIASESALFLRSIDNLHSFYTEALPNGTFNNKTVRNLLSSFTKKSVALTDLVKNKITEESVQATCKTLGYHQYEAHLKQDQKSFFESISEQDNPYQHCIAMAKKIHDDCFCYTSSLEDSTAGNKFNLNDIKNKLAPIIKGTEMPTDSHLLVGLWIMLIRNRVVKFSELQLEYTNFTSYKKCLSRQSMDHTWRIIEPENAYRLFSDLKEGISLLKRETEKNIPGDFETNKSTIKEALCAVTQAESKCETFKKHLLGLFKEKNAIESLSAIVEFSEKKLKDVGIACQEKSKFTVIVFSRKNLDKMNRDQDEHEHIKFGYSMLRYFNSLISLTDESSKDFIRQTKKLVARLKPLPIFSTESVSPNASNLGHPVPNKEKTPFDQYSPEQLFDLCHFCCVVEISRKWEIRLSSLQSKWSSEKQRMQKRFLALALQEINELDVSNEKESELFLGKHYLDENQLKEDKERVLANIHILLCLINEDTIPRLTENSSNHCDLTTIAIRVAQKQKDVEAHFSSEEKRLKMPAPPAKPAISPTNTKKIIAMKDLAALLNQLNKNIQKSLDCIDKRRDNCKSRKSKELTDDFKTAEGEICTVIERLKEALELPSHLNLIDLLKKVTTWTERNTEENSLCKIENPSKQPIGAAVQSIQLSLSNKIKSFSNRIKSLKTASHKITKETSLLCQNKAKLPSDLIKKMEKLVKKNKVLAHQFSFFDRLLCIIPHETDEIASLRKEIGALMMSSNVSDIINSHVNFLNSPTKIPVVDNRVVAPPSNKIGHFFTQYQQNPTQGESTISEPSKQLSSIETALKDMISDMALHNEAKTVTQIETTLKDIVISMAKREEEKFANWNIQVETSVTHIMIAMLDCSDDLLNYIYHPFFKILQEYKNNIALTLSALSKEKERYLTTTYEPNSFINEAADCCLFDLNIVNDTLSYLTQRFTNCCQSNSKNVAESSPCVLQNSYVDDSPLPILCTKEKLIEESSMQKNRLFEASKAFWKELNTKGLDNFKNLPGLTREADNALSSLKSLKEQFIIIHKHQQELELEKAIENREAPLASAWSSCDTPTFYFAYLLPQFTYAMVPTLTCVPVNVF